jgi:PRTRC genetic system ThiF family protein
MNGIFNPHIYIRTITIVGLGGTGAQVARLAGRMAYAMRENRQHVPRIILIDPDRVEESNVGRQLFAPGDVGQFKVEVVGRRLNLALGLDVAWIPEMVNAERHFERQGGNLVISCVDNHLGRAELHKVEGILIGTGNHAESGQVCIGNTADRDLLSRHLAEERTEYPYLPREGLLFPGLLMAEDGSESQPGITDDRSCAELAVSGEQSLLVNDWMACIVGQYLYRLLQRQPITTFLTYILTTELVVRSLPINREEISACLQLEPG